MADSCGFSIVAFCGFSASDGEDARAKERDSRPMPKAVLIFVFLFLKSKIEDATRGSWHRY